MIFSKFINILILYQIVFFKKRDKVKQFNCIDDYNKYIHQIEDQIKIETKEHQKREEVKNMGLEKKEIELEFSKILISIESILKPLF